MSKLRDLFDRAVEIVSSARAFERQQWREALALSSYAGAAETRTLPDFVGGGEDADAALLPHDLDELRNRSRALLRNSSIAASMAEAFVDSVAGPAVP